MSLKQMQVFNQYYMPVIIETLSQMVKKFNSASNGALRLSTEGFTGDFYQESFFSSLHSAQRRVDRYATNDDAQSTDMSKKKQSSLKISGVFGPIKYEPSQLTWLQQPTAAGIEVVSRNFAEAIMQDQLNTAILGLVSAISNQPEATNDISAQEGISYAAMNDAHALFGDHSGNLVAQIMNGTTFHRLIGENLKNGANLFKAQTVNVVDILGRVIVVTDAPALYTSGTESKCKVLSLVENAAIVHDGKDIITNIDTQNGKNRIETTIQMDYTFGLGLKGYSWDEANGGRTPKDDKIGTGSNWNKIASSIKETAGVITIADATKK